MFILKCKRDDSVCKVDDSEVIYNEDSPPKDGEDVKFYYGDKQELGQVIMMSDYIKKINTKFEQIKQSLMKRTRPSSSPKIEKESVSTKRTRKINSKYTSLSFENMDLLKLPKVRKSEKKEIKDDNRKKGDKILQTLIEKDITVE
ncbi:GSCOCG00012285001-RA-CDS [Cotesia congregata]|nr:GSCOCG00012285001-RA-CDS [Cotesia congregata]